MEKFSRLAARMAHIAPFEVMEIQTQARALEAMGRDVIHMEIGEPDFPTPTPIIEAGIRALRDKPMIYTSALGIQPLREAIAAFYQSQYGVVVPPERIIVTAGSSAALLLTMAVLLNAGDEVLMADPGYPCNRHFVRAMEGIPKTIPVGAESAYQMTRHHIATHWGPRSVAALVASPSNPTGTLMAADELAAIYGAVQQRGGMLIVDEIYQGLTYGVPASTALTLGEDMFVINSFSKYFQMTGWRLGWLVAPPAYVREIEKLAQNLFISPSTPAQHAALAAFLPGTLAILEERRAAFQERRDFLMPGLRDLGFEIPTIPQGAFYIYADSSRLAADSFDLSRRILQQSHVALTPGKDFGSYQPERHIRIAYTNQIGRLT
ncbi:MAG: pyridoxal phosphate-dependent aminotransferase, partial [Betaproteobacteria bacterium]|nr:pyridoxal phosphate-dependent aminotransferase [Betaproteobacteria bacterium]